MLRMERLFHDFDDFISVSVSLEVILNEHCIDLNQLQKPVYKPDSKEVGTLYKL